MVAQVISPMLWVFFYLPAMKGKVIKHSKLFTATYIGGLYKSYIDSMYNEYHCIILGIMMGVHLSQAITAIKLCEFRGVQSAFIKAMWFVQTFIHGIWSLFEISNHQKRRLKSTKKDD